MLTSALSIHTHSYSIDPSLIGRLEVGTETLIDKSKSTKTVLMQLFPDNCHNIEGCTVVNACYGGTAAVLNALAWVETVGQYQNNSYAIVVATDIATYAPGPARPTGGAGAVALLIGPDSSTLPVALSMNPRHRCTHAAHAWDFYKPNPAQEHPVVDGALSQVCYYRALECVYKGLQEKLDFSVETPDAWVFHAPYHKLVQKSFARLYFLEARKKTDSIVTREELKEWMDKPLEETYTDKGLEKVLKAVSSNAFAIKCIDSCRASQLVGNTYTASAWLGLCSLLDQRGRLGCSNPLTEKSSIALFSYGSGSMATLLTLKVHNLTQLQTIAKTMQLSERLAARDCIPAAELDRSLALRAYFFTKGAPYTKMLYPTDRVWPGTFVLSGMDEQWRRTYRQIRAEETQAIGTVSKEVLSNTSIVGVIEQYEQEQHQQATKNKDCKDNTSTPVVSTLQPAKATPVLITGIAAGLPGLLQDVFSNSIDRLLSGTQCITEIPESTRQELLDKNLVHVARRKNEQGDTVTVPTQLNTPEQVMNVAAQVPLEHLDLTKTYGVPAGLAQTMDGAARVAVAAGFEALQAAGLVQGRDKNNWKLPENLRDGTGVVYASSFPALDAAVREVQRWFRWQLQNASSSRNAQALVDQLRTRLTDGLQRQGQSLSADDHATFTRLEKLCELANSCASSSSSVDYTFDRKFLFRVLVLGNAQLAQLAGCRGPNTQTNAACAGTTQALALAQDWISSGRADRVVVIAGDTASGETLLPWLGAGFCVLGAASCKRTVEEAAVPFDKRRSGMVLGAGGIGIVVESQASYEVRSKANSPLPSVAVQARLLLTQYTNSAYHGAALDRDHIARELSRFLATVETRYNITKEALCKHGIYFSHETGTHATDATSCAGNEVAALRMAFGDKNLENLLICNTKGFTGHPMGVSFEDVTAIAALFHQRVPAIPNYAQPDPYLGADSLKLSMQSGPYECKYALRFAAGFGSQVAFSLYGLADDDDLA